jgi:hypothetical protein
MKDISEELAIELGQRIVTLLNVAPIGRNRYKTTLGTKEIVGIGRLLNTIYRDIERKSNKKVI